MRLGLGKMFFQQTPLALLNNLLFVGCYEHFMIPKQTLNGMKMISSFTEPDRLETAVLILGSISSFFPPAINRGLDQNTKIA